MARFRPAGSRRATQSRARQGLIPCAILILAGFALLFFLFYEVLKSGAK